uniref:Uncharacterized protein n=1 Tax=Zea mays TaxID=4577 RepID=B6SYW7_MAIZE|nr:hypothetical protein [Zea mays]
MCRVRGCFMLSFMCISGLLYMALLNNTLKVARSKRTLRSPANFGWQLPQFHVIL